MDGTQFFASAELSGQLEHEFDVPGQHCVSFVGLFDGQVHSPDITQ